MHPNEYDDPEQPHGNLHDDIDIDNMTLKTLMRIFLCDAASAALMAEKNDTGGDDFHILLTELERTFHEIKTTLGHNPPSTGSRRCSVRDCHATRLLRGCERTASLLGGNGPENPAVSSGLGNVERCS